MKIAILSDSHDNVLNMQKAVEQAQKMNAEALIFCGDFCSPGMGKFLCAFDGSIYIIFGNNDGDRVRIFHRVIELNPKAKFFYDGEGEFELGGRKIAINHYPLYGRALARTGDYDLVCFGHSHIPGIEIYGSCLAVNPGSTEENKNNVKPSFAIYDTDTHKAVLHTLDGSILTI